MYARSFFILLLCALLQACVADDTVSPVGEGGEAMTFRLQGPVSTRAGLETVAKDFRVYAVNGSLASDGTFTPAARVMDNYIVWWDAFTAHGTETNSSDWEYVGLYTGDATDAMRSTGVSTAQQTLKLWDKSKEAYLFYGLAKAQLGTFATDAQGHLATAPTTSALTDILFTEPVVVRKADYGKPVVMAFKSVMAHIRVGLYTSIDDGWRVGHFQFYIDDEPTTASTADHLYLRGTLQQPTQDPTTTITYPTNINDATTVDITHAQQPRQAFGPLQYTRFDGSGGGALARTNTQPAYAQGTLDGNYIAVLPYAAGDLTLRCDYRLTSVDTDETIDVHGATVAIPAIYTQWQPSYAYTYLLKVTDDQLRPIVLTGYYQTQGDESHTYYFDGEDATTGK